jgi:endo-1,4-beta-xylanase
VACSGKSGNSDDSEPSSTGGADTGGDSDTGGDTGGASSTGGGASGGVAHTGGSATTGGRASSGGDTSATGGTSTSEGGTPASGGRSSTGGSHSGGSAGSGGTTNTAGNSSATGGRSATGGVAGGGGVTTGGTSANGGAPTGGVAGTGGMVATGGAGTTHRKYVGNTTTGSQPTPTELEFADYWDQITPEVAGQWRSVQSSTSVPFDWTALDAIRDYARLHQLLFVESAFVWGAGEPVGIKETHVRAWMTAFCERYPDTAAIVVVNEPPPHTTPSYINEIGGNTNGDYQWIVNSFVWAREACPNAVLMMNDYNNIEWEEENAHFIEIVKTIQAAGAPIDAVGAEAHFMNEIPGTTVKFLMEKLHTETGLPVYVTEYDVAKTDDATQLAFFQEQFPLFYEAEYVHGITLWGWIVGKTWRNGTGLVDLATGTSRPAMTWLMQYLGRPQPELEL